MESHSQQRRRASNPSTEEDAGDEDRLGRLPDDLLHPILRGLPLKEAVRTGALSRRWAPQWSRALAASPVLDLAACGGPVPGSAVATVRRCLADHLGDLDVFRVAFRVEPPSAVLGAVGRDIAGLVAAAVARGARELDVAVQVEVEVDLAPGPPTFDEVNEEDALVVALPGDLFQQQASRNSPLERLALSRFSLKDAGAWLGGLAGLRSLSLSHGDLIDEELQAVLASCRALESLSLRSCPDLTTLTVESSRLRALELLGCWNVFTLRVDAPALESFTFYGHTSFFGGPVVEFDMDATPLLRDAYLSHLHRGDCIDIAHDGAYPYLYDAVANARILTLCSTGWHILSYWSPVVLHGPVMDMPNVQDLQLLVEDDYCMRTFFAAISLPLLQRLFVRLPSTDWNDDYRAERGAWTTGGEDNDADEPQEDRIPGDNLIIALDRLTFLKIVNFTGAWRDLRLLSFFLDRAPILQHLVLLTVEGADDHLVEAVQERVSEVLLHKAPRDARIAICRPSGDDSPNHAHTSFFHEEHAFFYEDNRRGNPI